jgi:hypothetical protein
MIPIGIDMHYMVSPVMQVPPPLDVANKASVDVKPAIHDAEFIAALIGILKQLDETGQLTGVPNQVFGV